jgi:hypothetical protein
MRVAGGDKGLIVNDGGVGKFLIQLAVYPVNDRLSAHRQLAFFDGCKIARRPFDRLQWHAPVGHVAAVPRIRPTRVQAFERVDDKRQRLVFNPHALKCVGCCRFIDSCNCENRFTDVVRVIREHDFSGIPAWRNVVRCQYADDAFHFQRFAGVNAGHPGMWHRAQQHFAKDHTLDAKVFCEFRLAGYLAAKIRRGEVFP